MKRDKLYHLIAGFLIGLAVYLVTKDQTISAYVVIGVAALKEVVWDKILRKGNAEFYDFVATFFGWIILSAALTIIN